MWGNVLNALLKYAEEHPQVVENLISASLTLLEAKLTEAAAKIQKPAA